MSLTHHYPTHLDLDSIAADYPDRSILEADGQVQRWLRLRSEQLLHQARHLSRSADGAKLAGLASGVIGMLCHATPLGIFSAGLGLTAWGWAVFVDYTQTRSFNPLPGLRDDLFEWLERMGNSDQRAAYEAFMIESGISHFQAKTLEMLTYLPLEQYAEAEFLLQSNDIVAQILNSIDQNIRFLLYLRIREHYINYGSLSSLDQRTIETAIENAKNDYSVNYGQVEKINTLTETRSYGRTPLPSFQPPIVPIVPPIPFAPPDDRPHQSQRREVIEPEVDYVLDINRLEAETIAPAVVNDRPVAPTPVQQRGVKETGIEKILANPFESRAFFGAQRTGKSYLVACTSQRLAEKGIKVFHINLASLPDGDDTRYWGHARSVRADLAMLDPGEARAVTGEALKLVKDFREAGRGAILICDEWTIMGSLLHSYGAFIEPLTTLLADTIASFKSSGIQRQKAVWTIAPDIIAGGLTDTAKMAVKNLSLVLVAIPPWETVTWQAEEGGLINTVTFSPGLYGQLKRNYTGLTYPVHNSFLSGSNRIVFTDGHWYPVGVDKHSLKPFIKTIAFNPPEPPRDPIAMEFSQLINKDESV